jgi:large subunit ribosomal protein L29
MKPAELRNLSVNEIRTKLNDTREELMNLRFQMAIGGLTDHTRLRQTRREIARLLTVLSELESAAQQEGGA